MTTSNAFRSVPGAQSLAISVTAASLAVAQAAQPALGHAVYLICAPGLLACAATGGWLPATISALLAAGGGALVERVAGSPRTEGALHAGLLLTAILGFALWMWQRRRTPRAISRPAAPDAADPALVSELSQPLSAVSNYLGAARNMIARLELEDDELLDAVTRAGEQMARAGRLLEALRLHGALDRPAQDT